MDKFLLMHSADSLFVEARCPPLGTAVCMAVCRGPCEYMLLETPFPVSPYTYLLYKYIYIEHIYEERNTTLIKDERLILSADG